MSRRSSAKSRSINHRRSVIKQSRSAIGAAFADKTVVVTGHTGFKGSWLVSWLKMLGARVVGIALDPPTEISHFRAANIATDMTDLRIDIRDRDALSDAIVAADPHFVFHLAAQALVRPAYARPVETWEVNVLGTLHLLEALRKLDRSCAAVIITSDKCYDNVEWVWGYRETDLLGGSDPYSASKGAAELAIRSHVRSYFPGMTSKVRIASARAGNVIGGGDWAPERIVPDCVLAWSERRSVTIRNSSATRPWQHVLEPIGAYLTLGAALADRPELHGEAFNFGPASRQIHSVLELVQQMARHWAHVQWEDLSGDMQQPHESGLLKLNCDKALHHLGWRAVLDFEETVRLTAEWYRAYYAKPGAIAAVSRAQIEYYTGVLERVGTE